MLIKRIVPFLALLSLVPVSQAAETTGQNAGKQTTSKNYLRLDVFQARGGQSQEKLETALNRGGYDYTVTAYDFNRMGGHIAFGHQWSGFTYTELGVMDLGHVEVDLLLDASEDIQAFERDLGKHYPATANGFTLLQGFTYALDNHWEAAAEIGLFSWEEQINTHISATDLDRDDGLDLLLGLRIAYQLNRDIQLGVSVRRLELDDEGIDMIGFSSRLYF